MAEVKEPFCIGQANILYKLIYWRVEYLANQSVIIVGVTLIWQNAEAAIHVISYCNKTILALFKLKTRPKQLPYTRLIWQ